LKINKTQNSLTHLWMLLVLFCTMSVMAGCTTTGTQWAYSEAKTVDERAYVMLEHYAALVKEAADLAGKPNTPPEVIEAMKKADAIAMPAIRRLRDMRDAWLSSGNEENTEALQAAVDDAIAVIASMIRTMEQVRGKTP